MADDVELLRRYANERSEEAFTVLVQRHLPLVYHAALRRTNGDRHLAEDVAQAVFANLAKEAVSLQRHEVLAGWLYVATRHAAANTMRTELRRKTREREALTMSESSVPVVPGAEWEELRPELDSVMDELSEADRNAVLLRFFENRPYVEIGASFRISEDAARMRVDRALEKLRALLGRRGITSTAAALGGLLAAQSAVAAPTGLVATVTGSVLAGAGAGAVTTGTTGFIAFMTTNKIMLGITVGALLFGGGAALFEAREAQQAEIELGALREKEAAMEVRLARQAGELQRNEKELASARTSSATPAPASTSPKTQPIPAAPVKAVPVNSRQALFANSDYVALEMRIAELGAKLQYGPLYSRLRWSPDRIREFERLLMEQRQNSFDVYSAASANGVDLNSPTLKKEWDDRVFTENQAKMKALLGSEDYAAFVGYKPWASQGMLQMLAGSLYYTDTPLTATQGDAMTAIIERHTALSNDTVKTDWPAVYADAGQGVLSAAQVEIFRAVNDRNDLFLQKNAIERKILDGGAAPKN